MALDCYPSSRSVTPCPTTVEDWVQVLVKLLPPGFALEAAEREGTLLHGRVRAVAHLFQVFNEYACALLPEFVCDTADKTLDMWFTDYGLPDDCGINDLCVKVTSIGDGTCRSLQDVGHMLGFDLCCDPYPVEAQVGCWELGLDVMPPKVEWLGGGCDLGFLSLGYCPSEELGSRLGEAIHGADGEACNMAGYQDVEFPDGEPAAPCASDGCEPWQREAVGFLVTGCGEFWSHRYVGTAHHLQVGIRGSSSMLVNGDWPEMCCFEMGCAQLCVPPVAETLCFVERYAHAQLNIIPTFC